MKAVNREAQKIMQGLIDEMGESFHMRFNEGGTFMPLVVEKIGSVDLGPLYSFAHYYTQNGDAMRDPDMEFIHAADGKFYPISFRQDGGFPLNQQSVVFSDGKTLGVRTKMQRDHATFAGQWMENFKQQRAMATA